MTPVAIVAIADIALIVAACAIVLATTVSRRRELRRSGDRQPVTDARSARLSAEAFEPRVTVSVPRSTEPFGQ